MQLFGAAERYAIRALSRTFETELTIGWHARTDTVCFVSTVREERFLTYGKKRPRKVCVAFAENPPN